MTLHILASAVSPLLRHLLFKEVPVETKKEEEEKKKEKKKGDA
jgi:hypothetical protein